MRDHISSRAIFSVIAPSFSEPRDWNNFLRYKTPFYFFAHLLISLIFISFLLLNALYEDGRAANFGSRSVIQGGLPSLYHGAERARLRMGYLTIPGDFTTRRSHHGTLTTAFSPPGGVTTRRFHHSAVSPLGSLTTRRTHHFSRNKAIYQICL